MNVQDAYNLTLLDITYLMGNYGGRYYQLVSPDNLGKPVRSVARCLVLRFIADLATENRDFPSPKEVLHWPLLLPNNCNPQRFEEVLGQHEAMIAEHWPAFSSSNRGVLLGLSGARAIERWADSNTPEQDPSTPHPIVQRLMTYLTCDILARGERAVLDHMHRVELEAHARQHIGIDDVLARTRWNSSTELAPTKRTGRTGRTGKTKTTQSKS